MIEEKPEIVKERIEILRPCLHFHGIQIKSEKAFRRFAELVNEIEEVVGIHSCTISLEEIFFCPNIPLEKILHDQPTPTEKLLGGLIQRLDV